MLEQNNTIFVTKYYKTTLNIFFTHFNTAKKRADKKSAPKLELCNLKINQQLI